MSAVAPPTATSSQKSFVAPLDKEELIKFWRTGLEYIAQGVAAHQTASRYARASEIQSSRKKTTSATTAVALAATAQVAPHKETFESCVHALADLSPARLFQPAPVKQPDLDARVSTLEEQMRRLFDTVQLHETRLGTIGENLSRVEPIARSVEGKAVNAVALVDEVRNTLGGRIDSLSSQLAANPLPDALASLGKEREKLASRLESVEGDVKGLADKSAQLEVNLERVRPKIDEHSTKLVKMEGKIAEIRQNATQVNNRMHSLLALAPEAHALLTVPAQTKRAEQGVESLKKEYQLVKAEFDSMKVTLGAVEQKLADSTNQSLTSISSLTTNVAALQPLREHVNTLLTAPDAISQLRENVSEFVPLRAHIDGLVSVGAQASELLSHNERVKDDITQLRGKMSRFSKDLADAKKEALEGTRLLNEQVTRLSSASQATQDNLAQTKSYVAQLEGSAANALKESREVAVKVNGIDAKVKAGNFTAEWLKKQLEAMREKIAYLEPLGARIEALLLLSGQTEALMPLAEQFRSLSLEVRRLWEESEATDLAVERLQKLSTDLSTASEDAKQRLGQVEGSVNQLESDASNALKRLGELETVSNATTLQGKQNQQWLQKAQNQLEVLTPLNNQVESLTSLSQQCAPIVSLVQDFQKLKKEYDTDITSLKDQAKAIKSISSEIAVLRPLTNQAADTRKRIASLTAQQQQLENSLAIAEKVELRVAKVESESKQLYAKVQASSEQSEQSASAEAVALKARLGEVTGTANSIKKLAEELQPVRAQLETLQTLSSKAEELMTIVQKAKGIEDNMEKVTKYNKQVEELGDTVYSLDQLITSHTSKSDSNQIHLEILEREFKAANDTNEARFKGIEATVKEFVPLNERSGALLALVSASAISEGRIAGLERSASSLAREMKNVAGTLTRMDTVISSLKAQGNQCKTQESRLKELSESTEKIAQSLSPLVERTPALLAVLEKPAGQVPPPGSPNNQSSPERTETVNRCDVLEENIQSLRSFELKAKEELESLLAQVETVTKIADEILIPFVDQAKPLLPLTPLVAHVESLPPLVDQVAQLQATTKSLLDRLATAAAAEPSPPSQLRSPVTDLHVSRPASPSSNHGAAPLFSPTTEPRRLKRKRDSELEEKIESLEDQIDGMRAEFDDVRGEVDAVREMTQERDRSKKARMGEKQGPSPESSEGGELTSQARKKIERDLDLAMDTIRGLWIGEAKWMNQIDTLLGQQWAEVLEVAGEGPKGAANLLRALRSDVDVLKLAVEARGSGISTSRISTSGTSMVDASHIAGMEKLVEMLTENVLKEQNMFQKRLEEQLNTTLKPIKNMYRALRETGEGLE